MKISVGIVIAILLATMLGETAMCDVLQSNVPRIDTSDAFFEIHNPRLATRDVDMGTVWTYKTRDSIVADFFVNDSTVTVTIQQIYFTGVNVGQFNCMSALPITVAPGDTAAIDFRFGPIAPGLQTAQMMIVTSFDTMQQTIVGAGVLPPYIFHILFPNGGEKLIAGSDTTITWTGPPQVDTIQLEYSIDSGKTWQLITTSATGGAYRWHVPIVVSDLCWVRGTYRDLKHLPNMARGGGGSKSDVAGGIVAAQHDAIYVAGAFTDTAHFGQTEIMSQKGQNFFVAKYNSSGTAISSFRDGDKALEQLPVLATDSRGNLIVGGSFEGYTSTIQGKAVGSGFNSIFLAKYLPGGSPDWVVSAGGDESTSDFFGDPDTHLYSIAVDRQDNIYALGIFDNNLILEGDTLQTLGGSDLYVAKFDSAGILQWIQQYGCPEGDLSGGLAIDSSNNVYVSGSVGANFVFGDTSLSNVDEADLFVAKLTPEGKRVWLNLVGVGPGDFNEISSMCCARSGAIYVAGNIEGKVQCGDTSFTTEDVFYTGFVEKLLPDGSVDWVRHWRGSDENSADAICVDRKENVCVGGAFFRTLDIEGRILISNGTTQSVQNNVIVAKYDSSGISLSADRAGGPERTGGGPMRWSMNIEGVSSMAFDDSNNLYVTGNFLGTGDFGDTTLVSAGSDDVFLWRLNIPLIDTCDAVFSIVTLHVNAIDSIIDFGNVFVGQHRDSLRALTIRNASVLPLIISATREVGAGAADFSTLQGAGPFTLNPGESSLMDLRFAPASVGRSSAQLLFDYAGSGSPVSVILRGIGTGPGSAIVKAGDASGNPGDIVSVPVTLIDTVNINFSGATSVSATLRFNGTLLDPIAPTPRGSLDAGNERSIPVTFPMPPQQPGNILGTLHFRAMLGTDTMTTLHVDNPSSNISTFGVGSSDGTFTLLGTCRQGGVLLYDPNGLVTMKSLRPNPSQDDALVEISTTETGHTTLQLVNALGMIVETLLDGEVAPGTRNVAIPTRSVPTGSYRLILQTPTVRRSMPVIVQR